MAFRSRNHRYNGLQYERPGLMRLLEYVQGRLVQVLPTRIDSPDSAPSSLNGVSNEYLSSFSIKRHSHPEKTPFRASKRIVHVFSCRPHDKRRYQGPPSSDTKRKIGGLHRAGCGPTDAAQASVRRRSGSEFTTDALCGDEAPSTAAPSTPSLVQGRPMDV